MKHQDQKQPQHSLIEFLVHAWRF